MSDCVWTGILLVAWSQVTPWANFLGLLVSPELEMRTVTRFCTLMGVHPAADLLYPLWFVADVLPAAHMADSLLKNSTACLLAVCRPVRLGDNVGNDEE